MIIKQKTERHLTRALDFAKVVKHSTVKISGTIFISRL